MPIPNLPLPHSQELRLRASRASGGCPLQRAGSLAAATYPSGTTVIVEVC
jgi:hypothetical protein